nr:metalloregulator ArsR/SmtB family transcription factor [Clostridiales bacterium]
MELKEDIAILAEEFKANQKVFIAIGDEVRQHILLEMLKHGNVNGMRVNDIAATTNLSRPAVSHHLQILKDAGIIKVRKEGTKNYYYIDPDMDGFYRMVSMFNHALKMKEHYKIRF